MILPPPADQYDKSNEAQTRATIASEDARNVKNTQYATTTVRGVVKVDGTTLAVASDGTASVNQLASTNLTDVSSGTWTPALKFAGASVGMTYSQQAGSYTKIGTLVFCSVSFQLSAKGSSTGAATITGLPFTSRATVNQATGASSSGLTFTAPLFFSIAANGTTITLENGTGPTGLTDTAFSATTLIVWNFFYFST